MGDPRRQHKKYATPRHPWRRDQLDVELRLLGEYGLRNKHELWRYKTMLSEIRGIARALLAKSGLEREKSEQEFLLRLKRMGLAGDNATIDDTLDLDIRDLLERRLQTVVFRNGLAGSPSQARQLIAHGHVSVGGRTVSVPSYLVTKTDQEHIGYSDESALAKSDHPVRKAMGEQPAEPSPPEAGSRKGAS